MDRVYEISWGWVGFPDLERHALFTETTSAEVFRNELHSIFSKKTFVGEGCYVAVESLYVNPKFSLDNINFCDDKRILQDLTLFIPKAIEYEDYQQADELIMEEVLENLGLIKFVHIEQPDNDAPFDTTSYNAEYYNKIAEIYKTLKLPSILFIPEDGGEYIYRVTVYPGTYHY